MGKENSIYTVFEQMGAMGQIVSILIFIMSIVAVYIFVQRLMSLKTKKSSKDTINKVTESIAQGNVGNALEYCKRVNTPLSRVLAKGVQRVGMPLRDIDMAMEKAIDNELYRLERGEEVLSLISKLAPMLGFIGTILGVIQIFYTINSTGNYNIESISGGLYVKMITSALGLSLGIVAYFFYFIISAKVKKNLEILEIGASDFLDKISLPSK